MEARVLSDSRLNTAPSKDSSLPTDDLTGRLSELLLVDQRRIESALRRIRQRETGGKDTGRDKSRLRRQLTSAEKRSRQRRENLPHLSYPAALPVSERVAEIVELVKGHQVTVICGETGSGKSTQLPKICVAAGRGRSGSIAHTQPRRIAARSIASRVAGELNVDLGSTVGYRVRFDEKFSDETIIKVMTDGMLLAEIESDRQLLQYDTVILDEAHERSLNIDLLLGYLKNLLSRRPDMRLVITSATLEVEKFRQQFTKAPVLEVSGRTYPVEVRYRPAEVDEVSNDQPEAAAVVRGVGEALEDGPGDVLVFLPGEREIRESEGVLRGTISSDIDILPLYGRLSIAEQQRIFAVHQKRRVVLATNVAETSLTVPGIRYVVDLGLARISRYSPTSKIQRLQIEKISQASARQRAGRCGRVSDGVCIRLYPEDDFDARARYTDPEILRTSLASVILKMEAMQLGRIDQFPLLDRPDKRQINAGYRLLRELDALDHHNRLTPTGRTLARLPVDPRIGRIMLAGSQLGCLREVLVIAAALESNDPRVVPHDEQQRARQYHRMHPEAESDFLVLLSIWNDYCAEISGLSRREQRRWCEERFLSPVRMREWHDLHKQLRRLSRAAGLVEKSDPAAESTIHKALLAGFLGQVAQLDRQGFYRGTRNKIIALWPASRLVRGHKRWIMAAEFTQTSRVYARHVAAIQPEWIDEVAPHQLRYSHADPKWSASDGRVIALESATLWGLNVISGRKVNYGQINPVEARAIFIRDGLAEDKVESRHKFVTANRALRRELEKDEEKLRRPGMYLDRDNIVAFFEKRIPPDVVDTRTLEKWLSGISEQDEDCLFLTRAEITGGIRGASIDNYPDWWIQGESRLPLRYRCNPGGEDDGITLEVPLYLINQLKTDAVERLVPGYLEAKLVVLLKSLPKRLRRKLVPLPATVSKVLDYVAQDQSPLVESLITAVRWEFGVSLAEDDFGAKDIPADLAMRIAVVSDEGRVLDVGRDIKILQHKYGAHAETLFGKALAPGVTVSGRKDWDFGDLPERIVAHIGGSKVTAYPALVDEGSSVGVEIFDTHRNAVASQRSGLYRLLLLRLPDQRRLLNKIPNIDHLCLLFATVGHCKELGVDIRNAVLDRAFACDPSMIRSRAAFDSVLAHGRERIAGELNDLLVLVLEILHAYTDARRQLAVPAQFSDRLTADVEKQLSELVSPGFLSATPQKWLSHLPRYLAGIKLRLEKADRFPDVDSHRRSQVLPFLDRTYDTNTGSPNDPQRTAYRWAVEEFRVSIFAQELGTSMPVSAARLDALWATMTQRDSGESPVKR